MAIPQTSDSLGDILRLKGLKNVSGRRKVMPGSQFLQNLNPLDEDVSGIAQPEVPPANLPMPELGGELSPQSYDVRANQVAQPEEMGMQQEAQPEQESMWTRFGKALAMQAGHMPSDRASPPPIETQQVENAEGLPAVNPEMEGQEPPESANNTLWGGVANALKEYIAPFGNKEKRQETQGQNEALIKEAQLRAQGINPEEQAARDAEAEANTQASLKDQIDQAVQNPLEVAVYGATDTFAKNPDIQKQFKEITGLDFTPEIQDLTKKYEAVITGMDQELAQIQGTYDAQMARIKERIDAGNATDADKFYVGLSLLMPLLVGGLFGKEAGLGALAGGAKGFADILGRRQKETAEGEEALASLNKERSNLALKRGELEAQKINIPNEIKKGLPKDERAFLKGKKEVVWTNPETGEESVGVEVKPGLVALPEYVNSKEELAGMTKEANSINEAKTATQLINTITDDIIDIASKLKNKDFFSKGVSSYLLGKKPDLASKLSEKVEFEGRMVNAGIVLEHKLKLLTDAYRQAKGMKALTATVQEHIDGLFRNPSASFQNYEDTVDQMLYTKNLTQKNLIQNAANHGFAPEFLQEEFGKKNKETYGRLNKKVEEQMSNDLLRE